MKKAVLIFCSFFTLACTVLMFAQDMPVPVEVQLPLLMKIISFDRNLHEKVQEKIVIGVVYQERFRTSNNIMTELSEAFESQSGKKVMGFPVEYVSLNLSENTDISSFISRNHVSILVVLPLRAFDMERITSIARTKKILTYTGVPEYVEKGIAVGIGIKGEKPEILINLTASKAEGADFNSQLLRLAKIIQ